MHRMDLWPCVCVSVVSWYYTEMAWWTWAGFWHWGFIPLILHCFLRKLGYLHKLWYSGPLKKKKNFHLSYTVYFNGNLGIYINMGTLCCKISFTLSVKNWTVYRLMHERQLVAQVHLRWLVLVHLESGRLLPASDDAWIPVWACVADDQRRWRWHRHRTGDRSASWVQVWSYLFSAVVFELTYGI